MNNRSFVFEILALGKLRNPQAADIAFSHMRRRGLMEVAHLLVLSDDKRIGQFTITASVLLIEVISTQQVCC